jgi:hypothetical protein
MRPSDASLVAFRRWRASHSTALRLVSLEQSLKLENI